MSYKFMENRGSEVNLGKVASSVETIAKSLREVQQRRERLLKDTRDVITLSAKTIVALHTGKLKEAQGNLKKINGMLRELRGTAGNDLDRYLIQPETEFVEATIIYSIVSSKGLPSHLEVGVQGPSYILGALDAVGEAKRMIYDKIRVGELERALELFKLMEDIYVMISPLAVYDHVAQGVKRKLDVARGLIEDVRATITEESRRSKFIKAVHQLSRRLDESDHQTEK